MGFDGKIQVKSDTVLAQHVMRMRAGTVNIQSGALLTAADALDFRIFGRGGHGSAPQTTIDPILIGAAVVMRLQGHCFEGGFLVVRHGCWGAVCVVDAMALGALTFLGKRE